MNKTTAKKKKPKQKKTPKREASDATDATENVIEDIKNMTLEPKTGEPTSPAQQIQQDKTKDEGHTTAGEVTPESDCFSHATPEKVPFFTLNQLTIIYHVLQLNFEKIR